MDETRTHNSRQSDAEANILSRIVDAMLAVQDDLQTATVEQWTRTVVNSCRRQKQMTGDGRATMAASC
jgi:hypothetical protein